MDNLEALRQAATVSPDNVPLLLLYGQALLGADRAEDARAAFERCLKLQAKNREALRGLARALAGLGRTSEAVVRLESIVGAHPDDAEAWLLLARIYLSEKNRVDAAAAYERACGLRPALRDPKLAAALGISDGGDRSGSAQPTVPVGADGAPFAAAANTEEDAPWGDAKSESVERPRIRFADVGGMAACKEEIRMKILYPLQNPDLFKAYGKPIGGGVLLYGPPGCGKTLLSRATAGEIKAGFIAVGLHEILDMYLGNSEKNLHGLFETARRNAPCVLFFDEVDALAADRNDLKRSAGRTLVNQFLAELDGSVNNNDGVLILGATNAPWHIDPAFRRPGRFDRVVFVPPPDEPARAAIVEILARGKPVAGLDAAQLARKTKDFSGADLKAVFDQATEQCLAQAMKQGAVVPLDTTHLLAVAKGVKPSTRSWFESAKNYALYANQGGFYNDILEFLGMGR